MDSAEFLQASRRSITPLHLSISHAFESPIIPRLARPPPFLCCCSCCCCSCCCPPLPSPATHSILWNSLLLIISRSMEPLFGPSSQSSIFESLLEACSRERAPPEEERPSREAPGVREVEAACEQREETAGNAWFLMEETPYETLLQAADHSQRQIKLEFKRLRSLRQEQEAKIATFLRQGLCASLRDLDSHQRESSPDGKSAQSLSPRKTKRIDKNRPLRLILESD